MIGKAVGNNLVGQEQVVLIQVSASSYRSVSHHVTRYHIAWLNAVDNGHWVKLASAIPESYHVGSVFFAGAAPSVLSESLSYIISGFLWYRPIQLRRSETCSNRIGQRWPG